MCETADGSLNKVLMANDGEHIMHNDVGQGLFCTCALVNTPERALRAMEQASPTFSMFAAFVHMHINEQDPCVQVRNHIAQKMMYVVCKERCDRSLCNSILYIQRMLERVSTCPRLGILRSALRTFVTGEVTDAATGYSPLNFMQITCGDHSIDRTANLRDSC